MNERPHIHPNKNTKYDYSKSSQVVASPSTRLTKAKGHANIEQQWLKHGDRAAWFSRACCSPPTQILKGGCWNMT